jgi:hypothetical protein
MTSRTARLLAATALVVSALASVSGCAAHPAAPPAGGGAAPSNAFEGVPLVPASGVYLGAYYGDGSVDATDEAIGRTPQLHLSYFGWEDPWATDETLAADRDRGQISLVNWEPFGVEFADIVEGRFDEMLTTRARQAAQLADPVFVDFAAEMNEEEGWGGHDPELYVAAYRHIHDIFAANDGGNVVWVWAPNNVDSDGAPAALDYYPGADYVDWTGIDGYNWGTSDPDFEWQSFEQVFRDVYDELHTLDKPILIGETASAEEGGSKADWIREIIPTLETEFPDIRGVVWFDVDKERDWRIRSSDETADALRQLAGDPLFRTSGP